MFTLILTPFPYIAVHLVQAPRIGGEAFNFDSLPAVLPFLGIVVGVLTTVVHLIGGDVLPEGKRGGCPGTAGVFPLGLAGQAQLQFGFHAVEFIDETLRVVPTDPFYREFCSFEMAGVIAHEDFPQGLGDGGFGDPKTTGKGDLALGFVAFVPRFAFWLSGWRPHQECPRFAPAEQVADALVVEGHPQAVLVFTPAGCP